MSEIAEKSIPKPLSDEAIEVAKRRRTVKEYNLPETGHNNNIFKKLEHPHQEWDL